MWKWRNLYIADFNNNRIREVTSAVGINELKVESEKLKVYPNPSNGVFTIQSSVVSQKSLVEIYNMLGEKVYQQFNIQNPTFNINLKGSPAGIYFYRVLSESGNVMGEGKLIIER